MELKKLTMLVFKKKQMWKHFISDKNNEKNAT